MEDTLSSPVLSNNNEPSVDGGDAPYVKLIWPLVVFGHAHLDSRTAYRPGQWPFHWNSTGQSDQRCHHCSMSLDISAAFDTIDLSVLLGRLMSDFGITGHALNRLRSCYGSYSMCCCWNFSFDHSRLYIWCSSGQRPGTTSVCCVYVTD